MSSILVEFIRQLLRNAPELYGLVKQTIHQMTVSDDEKEELIRELRATRDEEIDADIDSQVAAKFPKDE